MGCSTSSPTSLGDAGGGSGGGNERKPSSAAAAAGSETSAVEGDTAASKYPASEAFVIPLDQSVVLPLQSLNEASTASTADLPKAMPKRLQQLIEQQNAGDSEKTANLDQIEDKLQKAEERRKELLRQKVEQIQKTTLMLSAPRSPATAEADTSPSRMIQSKALDDDSKQQLLEQTLTLVQKS